MNVLLILPILVPLTTAIVCMMLWRMPKVQAYVSLAGATVLLAVGVVLFSEIHRQGVRAIQIGNWPAPLGITMVADMFAAMLVALTGLIGWATSMYSISAIDRDRASMGYYPLLQLLLMGVCGILLTGDVFNLFVWLEVMLIASFVLMSHGGGAAQIEGAIKYVTLNLLSSALLLVAVGTVYGLYGSLNMADLASLTATTSAGKFRPLVACLFLVPFGIKAAVFPLFYWLPASYHTPPAAVSAIFGGLLTKVGVYAMIRFVTLLFPLDGSLLQPVLLWVAGLTMVAGVLGAVAQYHFRRLLSFHVISQIGYLVMGLALWTPMGLAGAVFFMVHIIIAKTALFFVSGIVERRLGDGDLRRLGGLYSRAPFLAILFLAPALSLAGIPPLSGFFGKLFLVQAGLAIGREVVVGTAIVVSLLTLYSMTKIWNYAFWRERSVEYRGEAQPAIMGLDRFMLVVPTAVLAGLTVAIGLAAEPIANLSLQTSRQLWDRSQYIQAVMGDAQ